MSDLTWLDLNTEQVGVILLNSQSVSLLDWSSDVQIWYFFVSFILSEWKSIKSPLNPEISDCSIEKPARAIAGGRMSKPKYELIPVQRPRSQGVSEWDSWADFVIVLTWPRQERPEGETERQRDTCVDWTLDSALPWDPSILLHILLAAWHAREQKQLQRSNNCVFNLSLLMSAEIKL